MKDIILMLLSLFYIVIIFFWSLYLLNCLVVTFGLFVASLNSSIFLYCLASQFVYVHAFLTIITGVLGSVGSGIVVLLFSMFNDPNRPIGIFDTNGSLVGVTLWTIVLFKTLLVFFLSVGLADEFLYFLNDFIAVGCINSDYLLTPVFPLAVKPLSRMV